MWNSIQKRAFAAHRAAWQPHDRLSGKGAIRTSLDIDTQVETVRMVALKDAQASLPALVAAASGSEPCVITRDDEPSVVVLNLDDWRRLSKRAPTFAEVLLAFPSIDDADEIFARDRTPMRDIEL